MKNKRFIVIEGACDGIGKSTQFALLKERLAKMGHRVVSHHFPSYGTPWGGAVESYLKGEFGTAAELSPYFVNSLYAVDRAVTWKRELSRDINAGDVVLLDRYTTSSLIYQSAGITDKAEKDAFIEYVADLEYNKLGIPRPSLVIFLDAPYDAAGRLRGARVSNDGVESDIHESDDSFMRKVYDSAQYVCDAQSWCRVNCVDETGSFRSREDIHEEIFARVSEVLK